MGRISQGRLSRRKLIAVALAVPMVGDSANGVSATAARAAVSPDQLICKATKWIATNARIDAMSAEADELQGLVFEKAKKRGISSSKACRSHMPEARRHRALDRKVKNGYRDLEQLAGEVRAMTAVSIEGALVKIELALNVQGPFDWREHALELAEDGIAELRYLTTGVRNPALPRISEVRERMERPD